MTDGGQVAEAAAVAEAEAASHIVNAGQRGLGNHRGGYGRGILGGRKSRWSCTGRKEQS